MMTIIVARADDLVRAAMASAASDASNTMQRDDISKCNEWTEIISAFEIFSQFFSRQSVENIFYNMMLIKYNENFILLIVEPHGSMIQRGDWSPSFHPSSFSALVAAESIWDDELRGLKAIAGVNSVITSKPRPGSLCIASRCGHDVRGILHAVTPRCETHHLPLSITIIWWLEPRREPWLSLWPLDSFDIRPSDWSTILKYPWSTRRSNSLNYEKFSFLFCTIHFVSFLLSQAFRDQISRLSLLFSMHNAYTLSWIPFDLQACLPCYANKAPVCDWIRYAFTFRFGTLRRFFAKREQVFSF